MSSLPLGKRIYLWEGKSAQPYNVTRVDIAAYLLVHAESGEFKVISRSHKDLSDEFLQVLASLDR